VYFAGNLDRLYFLSSPDSRHGRNIAANGRAAAAINEDEHDWRAIRGIQLEGTCRPVDGPREGLRAWRTYLAKFRMVGTMLRDARRSQSAMAAKLLRTQMYQLETSRLFYLDNRRGFGSRVEIEELASGSR
jgi:uncharacterized protein YhbP (UPF0306 family)